MLDKEQFERNPRDYAMEMAENGCGHEYLLLACLKYMSYTEVREVLDINELSPRFFEED